MWKPAESIVSAMVALSLLHLLSAIPFAAHAAVIQLPQTGQKTCYNPTGTLIDCSGTKQDGELQTGVPAPTSRFTANTDGTVTDNLTGLIWLKDAKCFPAQNWPDALNSANTLHTGQCGLNDNSVAGDWRLPNIRELESLIDLSSINPALPAGAPFINVQTGYYWSSSTHSHLVARARHVFMSNGAINAVDKANTDQYVWPVRGGL